MIDTYRTRSPFLLSNHDRQDLPFKEFLLKSSRKAHKAGDRWLKPQYGSHCMVVMLGLWRVQTLCYCTCAGGCPGEFVSDLVGAASPQLQDVQPQRSHWANSRYSYQDVAMVSSITLYLILCLPVQNPHHFPFQTQGN